MKYSAENDLNALSSGILWLTGICLLLIPNHLSRIFGGAAGWGVIALGMIFFTVALANQVLFVLSFHQKRISFLRGISAFLLFVFAVIFIRADFFVEGLLVFFVGLAQLVLVTPFKKFIQKHPLELASIAISLSSGIYLFIARTPYAGLDISAYRTPLAVGFIAAAFLSAVGFLSPFIKYRLRFSRLTAMLWLAWCGIFLSDNSLENVLAPALLALTTLFGGVLPWGRLSLPKDDILGHRVIMIASTLELTMLIFLSALLVPLDNSTYINTAALLSGREAAFLFFIVISAVIYYEVSTINMTINGLMSELTNTDEEKDSLPAGTSVITWNKRLARYIKPFMLTREGLRIRLIAQADQIKVLEHQLANERKRNTQLTLLMELSRQLENHLDQPVAAQLTVNTLERALECSLASLYILDPEQTDFMLLAAAGKQTSMFPPGYRQKVTEGVIGRAIRHRKTQIVNNIREDKDYIRFEEEANQSAVVLPLIFNGHANGALVLNALTVDAFSSSDIALAEAAAAELIRAWERSGYHQRLMNLVQAGSQLSSMVEPESTAREAAAIAREILKARFTFVHIQLGQERNFSQSATSGDAPRLLASLQDFTISEALIKSAFQAAQPFRVRDVRKYSSTSRLTLDHAGLRSMLTIPIRWHRINIGAIFAFGKQNEIFFTENDESLAELLSIQTAGAFESTWLQQELRASLRITSLLYRLSNQIIQAENLEDAALDIAKTAHKLAKSNNTGIVLFNPDGEVMAELELDSAGARQPSYHHPMSLIRDAMNAGQLIHISQGQSIGRTCLPIQTPIEKYGAIWMDAPEDPGHSPKTNSSDLQALVDQAAIALERSLLLDASRRQAIEIKAAYDKLETTYDQTLASLMSALDARDRETEGHSVRVARLVAKLGEAFGFTTPEQLKILERGSLLHDIGNIGISDAILHKPGPLSEDEWAVMRLHPGIGAKIVEGIPFLEETIPLIRHHQERWDGTGYPAGFCGGEIPLMARIFAVVDAFDALTSTRPYRQKISTAEALEYLREQAGVLFDPAIVKEFENLVSSGQA